MSRVIVVCGMPGSGKTTLASALAARLPAAFLRVDVVETPLILAGIDVGPLGYQVVQEVAASNLVLGIEVVIDLVDPWPQTRRLWRELAARCAATLIVLERVLPDPAEHRRRVEARHPDLRGQVVPTWDEVTSRHYVPWDEERDGPRTVVDMTDTAAALAAVQSRLSLPG